MHDPKPIIKVILVDDSKPFLEAMKADLDRSREFQCVGVYTDPMVALREIPNAPSDVVLMETRIKGFSGIKCANRLKTLLPRQKIAIVSAHLEKALVVEALMDGASGYLLKPVAWSEMSRSIRSVMQGEVALSPLVQTELANALHSSNVNRRDLSPREREVLALLFSGKCDKEIAQALRISERTAHAHERSIYEKLGAHSRAQAIANFMTL